MNTASTKNTVTTKEIRRPNDNELLGLLIESGDQWIPATVFGGQLAPAPSRREAEDVVGAEGLVSLMESWWLRHEVARGTRSGSSRSTPTVSE